MINKKGKAYANRKSEKERPESDFYATPKSLVWTLLDECIEIDKSEEIWEPACGELAISNVLTDRGYTVTSTDIRRGEDFLSSPRKCNAIITNPPFSLFDEFVEKAQSCSEKFVFIGKTNFFGAYGRHRDGIWRHLRNLYIFNRQVDYRSPARDDGAFHVGNLVTGWFYFDTAWNGGYWSTQIVDVQKYATLGQFKEIDKLK